MFDSLASAAWLWVPCTLFAAAAQTVRNAAQRTLTDEVGALSATLVRFLFGLPLTVAWVAFLYWGPGSTARLPDFNLPYLGWIGMGAFFQIFATAALLRAMQERNFAVAVTLSKTEVLQVGLFSVVLLHELPTGMAVLAMVVATLGVLLLGLPRQGQLLSWRAWAAGWLGARAWGRSFAPGAPPCWQATWARPLRWPGSPRMPCTTWPMCAPWA